MPLSSPPPSWSSIKNKPSNFDVQAGTVAWFAAASSPTGWIKANGAALSRSTYATLFAAIGTTYGAGNGSTTFNVPDLRGEFMRSLDDGRGVDGGRGLGSFQADDFKSHSHTLTLADGAGWQYPFRGTAGAVNSGFGGVAATGGAETRPRNIALLACIKY